MAKLKNILVVVAAFLGGFLIINALFNEGLSLWDRIRNIITGILVWISIAVPLIRWIFLSISSLNMCISSANLILDSAGSVDYSFVIIAIIGFALFVYFGAKILSFVDAYRNKANTAPQNTVVVSTEEELREFYSRHEVVDRFETKVAGVSFDNSDGTSRQDILSRSIIGEQVYFHYFEYEGKPAYSVSTSLGQIGNLPATLSSTIDRKYDSCVLYGVITGITGGTGGLYYGCNISIDIYQEKVLPAPTDNTSIKNSKVANNPPICYPNAVPKKSAPPKVDPAFIAEAQWYSARGGADLDDAE